MFAKLMRRATEADPVSMDELRQLAEGVET
jgi:hypothetical protein